MNITPFTEALTLLPTPYVITDHNFYLLWANPCIEEHYPHLNATDSVRNLLQGYDLDELKIHLGDDSRSIRVPSRLPMVSTVLEISSVLAPISKEIEGFLVHFSIAQMPLENSLMQTEPMLHAFNRSLRTPLTSLFASLSILPRKLEEAECYTCGSYLTAMTQNCYQLLRTCTSITEFTRYSSGISHLNKTPVNFTQYLREMLDAAAILVREINVSLTYDLPQDAITLSIDPEKLSIALFSILSNSCTYHEGRVDVHVSAALQKNSVQIKITDNGYGMSPETLSRALEPYFSRGLDEYDTPGIGLGLPLTESIIKDHGGSMVLQSRQDKGTTVVLTLPLTEADLSECSLSSPSSSYLLNRFSTLHIFLSNVLEQYEM